MLETVAGGQPDVLRARRPSRQRSIVRT